MDLGISCRLTRIQVIWRIDLWANLMDWRWVLVDWTPRFRVNKMFMFELQSTSNMIDQLVSGWDFLLTNQRVIGLSTTGIIQIVVWVIFSGLEAFKIESLEHVLYIHLKLFDLVRGVLIWYDQGLLIWSEGLLLQTTW